MFVSEGCRFFALVTSEKFGLFCFVIGYCWFYEWRQIFKLPGWSECSLLLLLYPMHWSSASSGKQRGILPMPHRDQRPQTFQHFFCFSSYTVPMLVGTSDQNMSLQVDTGSSGLHQHHVRAPHAQVHWAPTKSSKATGSNFNITCLSRNTFRPIV